MALLFQHGEFTAGDTETTALVLRVYLFGLPFAAVDQMLVFASYARKDTWRPALVGVVSIVIYSITAVALLQPLGLLSLMVADSLKHVVHTALMIWILHRQIGSMAGHGITAALVKSLIAAALVGLAAFGAATLVSGAIGIETATATGKLLVVLAGGGAGVLVYTILVFALNISDAKSLRAIFSRG